MSEETSTTTTTEERVSPCFVRHPDAGGQCFEPGAIKVYGISFCVAHGEEARLGALLEENHEAEMFFERFRNPCVPGQSSAIERGLELVIDNLHSERAAEENHSRALLRAYRDIPEKVREQTNGWIAVEQAGHVSVVDTLMRSLNTLYKVLRIAHKEGEDWLVETLEQERQSVAAQAAVALEDLEHKKQAPAGA